VRPAAFYHRILLALLCLLALATSASAEGAWVLWAEYPEGTFKIMDAFGTNEGAAPNTLCNTFVKTYRENPVFKGTVFSCLPDTVDPRGPKGK
jgi:hypothetical protein